MRRALPCLALLLAAGSASAQDFGARWFDRVTHRIEESEAQAPDPRPLTLTFVGGEAVYFDDNVFLDGDDPHSDTAFVSFAGVKLGYAEKNFVVEADVLANYTYYVRESTASDDEERAFIRVRYFGPDYTVEIAEILRRESSPIDVIFASRLERIVSNTFPKVTSVISKVLSVEASANLQYVKFAEEAFEALDNRNYRVEATAVYQTWSELGILLQGGWLKIDYDENDEVPDAQGYYVHIGARGSLSQQLSGQILLGVARIESDDYPGTTENDDLTTGDVEAQLAYEATEGLTFMAAYTRRLGFSFGGAPFEVVKRATLIAEYAVEESLSLSARIQYEEAHTALGATRVFISASGTATYVAWENEEGSSATLEGGVTYREGDVTTGSTAGEFDNYIISLGLAITF